MLRLLLDEHLSPRLVKQFLGKHPSSSIESVLLWEERRLVGVADDVLLAEARKAGWTLVTYDQSTIVPLLKEWAEHGRAHNGVIFVDDRTIAPNDFGAIVRALGQLWEKEKGADWTDRVIYLRRAD